MERKDEKTFIMVKPDGIQRNLIGKVIQKFEDKGYKLIAAKLMFVKEELAQKHYYEHKDKPFFEELVSFITSGPVLAMVWEGKDIVKVARNIIGSTNPLEAALGTLRGDYGINIGMNIVHGSDSQESAEREIKLWFKDEELLSYEKILASWI